MYIDRRRRKGVGFIYGHGAERRTDSPTSKRRQGTIVPEASGSGSKRRSPCIYGPGGYMKIRIGCCGFPVSRKRYYSTFDVVEVQKTFYEPPQLKTVQRWRDSAPEGFEFTLKAWQLITHTPKSPTYRRLRTPVPAGREGNFGSFKPTDEVFEAWRRTREIATLLRTRVVVFQCPASFAPTDGNKKI